VIRSPFIYKKSQENFERKIHRRAVKLWDADMEVFNRWAKYLEVNALGGVDMRFVRWERHELGFGQRRLAEALKFDEEAYARAEAQAQSERQSSSQSSSKQGKRTTRQRVESIAEEIIAAELAATRAVNADQRSAPSSYSSPSNAQPDTDETPVSLSTASGSHSEEASVSAQPQYPLAPSPAALESTSMPNIPSLPRDV
jgi:small subunit ribosomal protein S10